MMSTPLLVSTEVVALCNLSCPFCYSRRVSRHSDRIDVEQYSILLREIRDVTDTNFIAVFGGGEPLLYPEAVARIARIALDTGSLYVSITTNGTLISEDLIAKLVKDLGTRLALPDGFITVSVDSYKLLASPRTNASSIDRDLYRAWRASRHLLVEASRRWGLPVPEEPPKILKSIEVLWEKEFDISLNILLTNDIIPLLQPPTLLVDGIEANIIYELARRCIQIQFLAPKPLDNLLSVKQLPGPRYTGKALKLVKGVIAWWFHKSPCQVGVDQAMLRMIGFRNPHADEGRFCAAGKTMIAVDTDLRVAPCSFSYHRIRWRPQTLHEILDTVRRLAPSEEYGCPYL